MSNAPTRSTKNSQWYSHFPGNFTDSTIGYTAAQIGVYILLRDIYWQRSGELPEDVTRRLSIYSASPADISMVLDKFFPEGRNADLDDEMNTVDGIRSKRREAGKAGGLKKGENAKAKETPKAKPEGEAKDTKEEPSPQLSQSDRNLAIDAAETQGYCFPFPLNTYAEAEKWLKEQGIEIPWEDF